MDFRRLSAIAGFIFALGSSIVLIIAPIAPPAGSSFDEVKAFLIANKTALMWQPIGFAFFLCFFALLTAGLVAWLRPGELERGEGWTVFGVIGGVGIIASILVAYAMTGSMAMVDDLPPSAVMFGFNLWNFIANCFAGFAAVYSIAFSIAGRQQQVLKPWIAWVGYAAALVNFIALPGPVVTPIIFYYAGTAGGILFFIWLVAISARMLRPSN